MHHRFMASKKSGENIPEGFRNTEAIKLRLDQETAQRLRSFAVEHGWSLSETVAEAFKALERELDADHDAVWRDS
jgi:hypothetical protein